MSPVYRFPAVGFAGPDFLNLAVGLDTELEPFVLNDWLHGLEDRHGRRRDVPRFSDRTLDIDIVLYGDPCAEWARAISKRAACGLETHVCAEASGRYFT